MAGVFFTPGQYEQFETGVFKILNSGQPGVFLVPPNTFRSNRLPATLIERNKSDFEIIKIDLFLHEIEDVEDLIAIANKKMRESKKKKIGVFMANAHTLLLENNFVLLNSIINLQEQYPHIHLVFLFNKDLTHPNISKNIKSSIFSNIIYYPLYKYEDVLGFIDYVMERDKISLSADQKEKIARNCEGYFWLVKQVVRAARDNPKTSIEDLVHTDGVRLSLEQFYTSLCPSEKEVLQSLIMGKKIQEGDEKHSLEYLQKIGLVKENKITIPFITSYIREYLPRMSADVKDNTIQINSVSVDSHFSPKEKRAFKALISKKNQIVSRDELAKAIWPVDTEENYSDWAVDRIVARLRDKIEKIGFSKDVIKTLRNKGYVFEG